MLIAALTEMPTIQVKLGNDNAPWHRPMISAVHDVASGLYRGDSGVRRILRMACGKRMSGYYAPRDESYEGNLCQDGCFSKVEILEAQRIARGVDAYEPMPTDLEREEVRRRLATGKFPKLVDDKKEE